MPNALQQHMGQSLSGMGSPAPSATGIIAATFIIEETEIQKHSGFPTGAGLGTNKHHLLISVSSQCITERMTLIPNILASGRRDERVTYRSCINHSHSRKGQTQGQIPARCNGWKGESWEVTHFLEKAEPHILSCSAPTWGAFPGPRDRPQQDRQLQKMLGTRG